MIKKQKPIEGQPDAYKNGWIEFYKLKFKVAPGVLIPRPETELLVDEVLNFVHSLPTISYPLTILDIGTGSGNIAISIAKNIKKHLPASDAGVQIIATDISSEALEIAKQNAKLHQVEDKITFVQSNLLCNLGGCIFKPDIIVTNLPYIPSERIPYLDCSVKDFEPWVALDGGIDGFELYRKLFQQLVRSRMTPRRCKLKLIVGEIDYTQGQLAIDEAYKYFPKAKIEIKKDLAQKQRILGIKFL